jgi:transcriptional regulator with XRE-family HTH domain
VVGEALAAARQRAGITQRGLAAALGKPQPFESAFENGQRRIDLLEFIAIAEALAADPSALYLVISLQTGLDRAGTLRLDAGHPLIPRHV